MIFDLIIAIMANVVAYLICKWLDSKFDDNQPK